MRIDLNAIIVDRDLDRPTLAKVLFPSNEHPMPALNRVIQGRARLKEEQIYRLSLFTGLSIDALYKDPLYWKITQHEDLVRFSRDNYSAIYSPSTGITKIYHLESLIATQTISASNQLLADYFREIHEIITLKSVQT
jgi:hypothetical protein